MKGRLITFEGIDGVGKSTHATRLVEYLAALDCQVEFFREPGGTPLGESLREIIKAGEAQNGVAELLLFAAARAELVETRIKPLLAEGATVVLDRFTDSSIAYQGALDEVPDGVLVSVCLAAAGGLYPDLTFWFDLDPVEAMKRRIGGLEQPELPIPGGEPVLDAIELRAEDYFTRVRQRYVSIHNSDPQRVRQVDCSGSVDETWGVVKEIVDQQIKQWNSGIAMNGAAN